tara:strand:- start:8871 stop:9779 length:909 start_codon:yes stop_codon:yes gene_type:complete
MLLVFDVKRASSGFVNNFASRFPNTVYNAKEESGGEKFYNYTFPTWNGKINEGDEAVFQGLIRNTREVYEACKEQERNFYYLDQPYFFFSNYTQHAPTGDRWYRIIKNDTQKTFIDKSPRHQRRYERLLTRLKDHPQALNEITTKPWRDDGKEILVIPPSYHTAKWYGIDRADWERYYVNEIKKYTKRPINVRHKFKGNAQDVTVAAKNKKDLYEDLNNAFAIVSFHSMCASQAVVHGIPSFCSEHSPAWPVSLGLNELDQIEDPLYSGERQQWLYSLLGSQFTEGEMKSGNAYRYVNGENV